MEKLRDFIKQYMVRRRLSLREMAQQIGVAHSTLSRFLSGDTKHPATPDFFKNIAHATGSTLESIEALADPSRVVGEYPPEVYALALRLAERLSKLPESTRQTLIDLIDKFE